MKLIRITGAQYAALDYYVWCSTSSHYRISPNYWTSLIFKFSRKRLFLQRWANCLHAIRRDYIVILYNFHVEPIWDDFVLVVINFLVGRITAVFSLLMPYTWLTITMIDYWRAWRNLPLVFSYTQVSSFESLVNVLTTVIGRSPWQLTISTCCADYMPSFATKPRHAALDFPLIPKPLKVLCCVICFAHSSNTMHD